MEKIDRFQGLIEFKGGTAGARAGEIILKREYGGKLTHWLVRLDHPFYRWHLLNFLGSGAFGHVDSIIGDPNWPTRARRIAADFKAGARAGE